MTELSDADLVARCLRGEPGGLEQLLERYQRPVFNIALRMLHDCEDARDVTQNVFVKAYQSLGLYDSRHKFFSWIYRIAVNESLNWIRKRKSFLHAARQWLLLTPRRTEPAQADVGADARLARALMKLKPEQRALVVLKHVAGCSYRDLSAILQVQEKTVKSRLFEARRLLREIVSAEPGSMR